MLKKRPDRSEAMSETIRNEEDVLLFSVEGGQAGKRLDSAVSELADLTRSAAARLISEGNVHLNGKQCAKNERLSAGDLLEIILPAPEPCEAIAEDIPLDVVYEDDDVIVVNKPSGVVVHPAAGNPNGTLVNGLLWHCGGTLSGVGGVIRPGIVHRIDKDTSGLLVVAKNDAAHLALAEQLKVHAVSRVYYAVALGGFHEESGTVDAPIGRHPTDRKRMAVIRNERIRSREAVTHWRVLAQGSGDGTTFSLVQCRLETGRTHQIRVHLASIGHPLLGDPIYGGNRTKWEEKHRNLVTGQMLHAGELTFRHPTTGEPMRFTAPMPETMQTAIRILFGSDVRLPE